MWDTINTSNRSALRIFLIVCCLFAVLNNSEGSLKRNCARCSQDKMKTASIASNIIHHPSGSRFTWSHDNSSLRDKIISPKAREEYLKNSQVKHMKHLETNKLQRENSKHHEISKRSVLHKKFLKSWFKRYSQPLKRSHSFANLAGRGSRENTHKGRHKRNIIDSTSKDVSAFKGPMRISLLIDGLPPSRKDPTKRETKGIKTGEAAWSEGKQDQMQTYHSQENAIYPEKSLPVKLSGEGKGLLTVKETAAAESLDLTKYVESQQSHVNIRRKRVYDILDKLFPARHKRQLQPQHFDSRLHSSGTDKSGADNKREGTLSLPMFGYSYNRVEDDSALNAKFLFV